MLIEYSLAIGKYEHEILQETTPQEFARYIAYRNIQAREAQKAAARNKLKGRTQKH